MAPPELAPIRAAAWARAHGDPVERLAAHALEWVAGMLPTELAIMAPVDRRLDFMAAGPIVALTEPGGGDLDAERLRRDYVDRGRSLDPFAPSRWNGSAVTVVSSAVAGGPEAIAQSPFGALLAGHGLAPQAAMFLRDSGRIVGALMAFRRLDQPEVATVALKQLRRCQPLVEHALWLSRPQPAADFAGSGLALEALTERELEVARLVATGASNAEISRVLLVSLSTVKAHMSHVLAKLDVRSRTELVARLRAMPAADPRSCEPEAPVPA